MARRRISSNPPLTEKQRELAQRENDLRKQMEDLQRMIAEAPRVAAETTRRQQEELLQRASGESKRLDVFSRPADKRYGEELWDERHRPRSLRKERSEGRLIFIVLVLALSAAVIWIATHLHF